MGVSHFRFPQISRFISATAFVLLWAGLGLLVGINSLGRMQHLPSILAYLEVLKEPLSPGGHIRIAQTLWETGQQAQAKREATLAQDLTDGAVVLGTATSPSELLSRWETEPIQLQSQFAYWKTVTQEKPDYRDAFVMAAAAAFKLGNTQEALELINRAYALDPTSSIVGELRTIIEQNLK